VLSAKFYSDALMNWSMKDQAFKVQLFRFVDAYPALASSQDIHEHLVDYLTQPGVKLPPGMELGIKAGGLAKGLFASTVSGQIKAMAQKFIAGTDAASALPMLKKLWEGGTAFSVDLLGEACVSDEEADAYQAKYLDLVSTLPGVVSGWSRQDLLEQDHLGAIARCNVSVKVSSLSARCDAIGFEGAIADIMKRLVPILEVARDKNVLVNFDMESHALKELTLELFRRCVKKIDFHAGLAMQAYLVSGVGDARRMAAFARESGRLITVRLVKGAYWDYETIHADQMGWKSPVWGKKWQTDACFEAMAGEFLAATPLKAGGGGGIRLALGSHNARSVASVLAQAEGRGLPHSSVELQMLCGMADGIKGAVKDMGLRLREYVPVGEMIPGMAYLVRRLLENTSNESWLKAGFVDGADAAALLAKPSGETPGDALATAAERHGLSEAVAGVGDARAFVTEPPRDFADRGQFAAFERAVGGVRLPEPPVEQSAEQAGAMVGTAAALFGEWRDFSPAKRCEVLVRAAAMMRARRDELCGMLVEEAGKCWRDADGEVCEAIDFCEYYARTAAKLFEPVRLGRFAGELNHAWHEPRGVAVVISPWNFPLAICCGMTAAALVTGNTVIVKPAEQTPRIARVMVEVLQAAVVAVGGKRDVVQLCAGRGETVGAALVRDVRTAIIAFTGSGAVGLDIVAAAGQTLAGQRHVKRVVAEMGGKNAVIIDTSADVDQAVLGVRQSAFGYQGQKCSACSRAIVVDPEGAGGVLTRRFIDRLVAATRALTIGDPKLGGTDIGPVIDGEAKAKVLRYIEMGKQTAKVELLMEVPGGLAGREYVGPAIFSGVAADSPLAREEIFGPVLSVLHVRTFEEGLAVANSLPLRLTGGVFSRRPAHIERARREFRVGNLYINRGITGALVGRQPFGGAGLSGVGSKAGGAEYLLQFVEPRAVCENTLRHGFSPEEV
jgi:RHH-type proline utilization regulon transcriptional repressor/proline dehydrogenase/delta 1-pyrroline-5-carboxylate dehydrogenase